MTIAELVQETLMYDLSNECFENVKECSEITAYCQWLKCQEGTAAIAESVSTYSEGFFMESVDANGLMEVQESVKEKAGKIWAWIVDKAKKLWHGLVTVFQKVTGSITGAANTSKAISDYLKIHPELQTEAEKTINHLAEKYGINLSKEGSALQDSGANLEAVLTAEFYVVNDSVAKVDYLADIVQDLISVKSKVDYENCKSAFENREKCLIVSSKKQLAKNRKKLADLSAKLEKYDVSTIKAAYATNDGAKEELSGDIHRLSAEIFKIIANDINYINKIGGFYQQALKELKAMISGDKKVSKGSKDSSGASDEETSGSEGAPKDAPSEDNHADENGGD